VEKEQRTVAYGGVVHPQAVHHSNAPANQRDRRIGSERSYGILERRRLRREDCVNTGEVGLPE
jgi:hypothetical protein